MCLLFGQALVFDRNIFKDCFKMFGCIAFTLYELKNEKIAVFR